MKKLMSVVALLTLMATSAFAENYNNGTIELVAVTDDYAVSIKTPETGANEYGIAKNLGAFNGEFKFFQNGSVQDYQLKATKQLMFPLGGGIDTDPFAETYVGAGMAYKWGDSLTDETLTASPYIGVQKEMNALTPFVEVGFDWQSKSGGFTDFDRNDSYLEYGSLFKVSDKMTLSASIVEDRSNGFDLEDKELALGMIINF
jgi:hypothetical protein